jgi:hypothetical protein
LALAASTTPPGSIAWLPGYLQTSYNLDLKSTGMMAAIPFLFGAAGMLTNGYVTDWLVKAAWRRSKAAKSASSPGCSAPPLLLSSYRGHDLYGRGLADWYGAVLHPLCGHIMLGIDSRRGGIKNDRLRRQYPELRELYLRLICTDGDRVYRRYHPVIPLALIICGCVTVLGALLMWCWFANRSAIRSKTNEQTGDYNIARISN